MRRLSLEELESDTGKEWAAEHGLQLSCQVVMDIGNHLLAQLGESRVDTYSDILIRLGERGVIPKDLAAALVPMAKMRNILVHQYLEVDPEIVYGVLQDHLEEFERFAGCIEKYMEK